MLERDAIPDKELKKILGWDTATVEEYRRFSNAAAKRELRADIKADTDMLLNDDPNLAAKYDEALEVLNSVYREAWQMICEKYEVSVTEFPCPY